MVLGFLKHARGRWPGEFTLCGNSEICLDGPEIVEPGRPHGSILDLAMRKIISTHNGTPEDLGSMKNFLDRISYQIFTPELDERARAVENENRQNDPTNLREFALCYERHPESMRTVSLAPSCGA